MPAWRTVLLCALLTTLLCVPLLPSLPLSAHFLSPRVREAAPDALAQLRTQGMWLVNVQLKDIDERPDQVCFRWEYLYRSRTTTLPPEQITTCR